MVVYYDLTTKEIKRTEDNTMMPILPANMDLEQKRNYYNSINENFICLPYEIGVSIFNFNLCFDANNNFTGLQPK